MLTDILYNSLGSPMLHQSPYPSMFTPPPRQPSPRVAWREGCAARCPEALDLSGVRIESDEASRAVRDHDRLSGTVPWRPWDVIDGWWFPPVRGPEVLFPKQCGHTRGSYGNGKAADA